MLPLPVAGGSSHFPGSRLVVVGEVELVELGPWDGVPGLWEDGCFSGSLLSSVLFWPVLSHSVVALLRIAT